MSKTSPVARVLAAVAIAITVTLSVVAASHMPAKASVAAFCPAGEICGPK